uniref:Uncharacterized protein n=1 Tax=Arundo donax TaxID=35708 RepID=A0A0A9FIP0_ARUDO
MLYSARASLPVACKRRRHRPLIHSCEFTCMADWQNVEVITKKLAGHGCLQDTLNFGDD